MRKRTDMVDHEGRCKICAKDLGEPGYLCDECDTVEIHRQHNPVDAVDEVTFYFGAASGSGRKALRELQEPNVIINYATANNTPWWGIQRLFIDSGGYSFIKGKGEYQTTNTEYLDFIAEHEPDLFALRDYPCEPEVLKAHGRTVADHQRMTTERHVDLRAELAERRIDATPVSVVQGWTPEAYRQHIEDLRDHGALGEYVAIGSVCRRHQAPQIREVILTVRETLPPEADLHAFGVKSSVLKYRDVREALTSADSQSYEVPAMWDPCVDLGAGNKTWHDSALEYLKQRRRIREACTDGVDEEQMRLDAVGP